LGTIKEAHKKARKRKTKKGNVEQTRMDKGQNACFDQQNQGASCRDRTDDLLITNQRKTINFIDYIVDNMLSVCFYICSNE